MSAQELGALLLFASAMSFTPGPNTTLSAALAANGGLRAAMRFVLGVPVGWGLLLLACVLGLGALLEAAPALRGAVKVAGLGYMLWLAWKLSRSGTMASASASGTALRVGFWQGVALQGVNIKAWMNALLISAGWITVDAQWVERTVQVLPLMMAFGFASNFTYALVGSALRHWLAHGSRLLVFNRVLAAVLVATAAWLAML
jgi:threonine/homoserine/homoserine lactone efflux protein